MLWILDIIIDQRLDLAKTDDLKNFLAFDSDVMLFKTLDQIFFEMKSHIEYIMNDIIAYLGEDNISSNYPYIFEN